MKLRYGLFALLLALALLLSACAVPVSRQPDTDANSSAPKADSLASMPAFDGSSPFVIIKEGTPSFTEEEITTQSFESYSPLDSLGRCGTALACIGRDLMPTEERGSIGQVKPSGWQTAKYDIVDGKYLYNRCHLIGFQLTGENANEQNLVTGTRYMNVDGMLPFENMVADYIKETGNHVLYRVTPVYAGDNLLCSGVFMEAYSVEDKGEGISFHVYCYNAQPGIQINYANGDSSLAPTQQSPASETGTYVLNTNSKKIHKPHCASVGDISPKNRKDYKSAVDSLLSQGYETCKSCF